MQMNLLLNIVTMATLSCSKSLLFCIASVLAFASCSKPAPEQEAAPKKSLVVTTTGMIGDLARAVGGEFVDVEVLMGPGVDPHQYKPSAADVTRLAAASLIFYNGLELEGKMGDLFSKMDQSGKPVIAVSEFLPKENLVDDPSYPGNPDPHVWFDAALWAKCVPQVQDALSTLKPREAETFAANAAALTERLLALDAWMREQAERLPEERRVLVTSHDAYNYFGEAYGFKVVGVQGISTVAEAGLADVSKTVDFIRSQKVPAIFVESSVNPAAIRRIADEAGVVVGGELFSDAMGGPGEMELGFDTGTYDGMMRYNMLTIVEGLGAPEGVAAP